MTVQLDDIGSARRLVAGRALLWLACLAPFFYLSYGFANWLASLRHDVPNLALAWERHIPFIAWSIFPYWSINLFYALALFTSKNTEAVDRLAKRYLFVQVVAVCCFIAFPLTVTFIKPQTDGLPGFMFSVLGGFDKPFNQAPSLHIALLVVIWDQMRRVLKGALRPIWHLWCILIGLSVLTTYQHHAVDIPAGALLGLFALWLFPREDPPPLADFRASTLPKARQLGLCYLAGSLFMLALAAHGLFLTAYAIVWLWPAVTLFVVALGYFGAGTAVFQKKRDGTTSLAATVLLAPYQLAVRINIWLWTRRLPARIELADRVYLGRFPSKRELRDISTVIDLAAEIRPPQGHGRAATWESFPAMDLVPFNPETRQHAIDALEKARSAGPVLICCALGFQRSGAVAADWLVRTGQVADTEQAAALIESKGWPVHLHPPSEVAG